MANENRIVRNFEDESIQLVPVLSLESLEFLQAKDEILTEIANVFALYDRSEVE